LLQGLADRAVILVRTADRLFEDRGVRRHPLDAVGIDQRLEVALGDEPTSEEVQPDRLAMVFECFDGIHGACSVRSVFWVSGSFRGQGRKVNIWLGAQPDGIGGATTITRSALVRSRNCRLVGPYLSAQTWRGSPKRDSSDHKHEVVKSGDFRPESVMSTGRPQGRRYR